MFAVGFRRIVLTTLTVMVCQPCVRAAGTTGMVGRRAGKVVEHSQLLDLKVGESAEISARVTRPSTLPDNARVRVSIVAVRSLGSSAEARDVVLSKVLHALDGDFLTVFVAKSDVTCRIEMTPEEGEITLFEGNRWRETGYVDELLAARRQVKWKAGQTAAVSILVRRIANIVAADGSLIIEAEPNNSPAQAQPIALRNTTDDYSLQIVGTSDDIEYFDNGEVGTGAGDDWLRLEFNGLEPRLLMACLTIPDQMVAARIRCYALPNDKATVKSGEALDVGAEYEEGKNSNERVHQQVEQHRIAINRNLKPSHVYFLRVEANAPGYGLELRVVKPAPFSEPQRAVRHALYDHIGPVSSWLNNRPRGASVERRIRDTGNLLGTHCMSCHTQSGVWGPAIPFAQGYRTPNVHLFRNLTNICYQSLRPTNELVEAANNTSLAPLDIGDGPAGTRVAGHSVVSLERFMPPRKLQSKQHLRASNFILQTADPGGINAAGPGVNVGKEVVFNYAGDILFEAWRKTSNLQFFRALEDKVRKTLDVDPEYTDDMAHRVELFRRSVSKDYVAQVETVLKLEAEQGTAKSKVPSNTKPGGSVEDARKLQEPIDKQVAADIARLRAIQKTDGTWGFNPGTADGDAWKVDGDNKSEPSPTALALIAFHAAGFGPDDPTAAKGVKGLLGLQHPSGYWKGQSQTGFVSTSYALYALSRLFPVDPPKHQANDFSAVADESLPETIDRVRRAAMVDEPRLLPILVEASQHESPLVRFWAMMGLGVRHADVTAWLLSRKDEDIADGEDVASTGGEPAGKPDNGVRDSGPESYSTKDAEFSIEQKSDRLVVKLNGNDFATYLHRHEKLTRPAWVHVYSPSGVRLTRNFPPRPDEDMGAADHKFMHPGIWISFGHLDGEDYWRLTSRTRHVEFVEEPYVRPGRTGFTVRNHYLRRDDQSVVCKELTKYTLIATQGGVAMLVDARFKSDDRDFYFGDQEESGLAVRMESKLRVQNGSGTILNSHGEKNGTDTWGKEASWVDYSGTTAGRRVGVMVVPGVHNARRCWMHTRDYGLVVANPFPKQPKERREPYVKTTVAKGKVFRLSYGVFLHDAPETAKTNLKRSYETVSRLMQTLQKND